MTSIKIEYVIYLVRSVKNISYLYVVMHFFRIIMDFTHLVASKHEFFQNPYTIMFFKKLRKRNTRTKQQKWTTDFKNNNGIFTKSCKSAFQSIIIEWALHKSFYFSSDAYFGRMKETMK